MAEHFAGCKRTYPDCLCLTCKHDGQTDNGHFCCEHLMNDIEQCKVVECPGYEKEDEANVQSAIPAER